MHLIFLSSIKSIIDLARAAPSVGSVPAPSSSKRTREFGVTFFKM